MGLEALERSLKALEAALQKKDYPLLEGFLSRLREGMEEAQRADPRDVERLKALLELSRRCEALILEAMERHREGLADLKRQRTSLRGYMPSREGGAFLISKRC